MGGFETIAAVTEALRSALESAVAVDVPGATVIAVRPDGPAGQAAPRRINVFLYRAFPGAGLDRRSPPRRGEPQGLVVDLDYLLTFHGDESSGDPQLLLGSALRALHARPVLTSATGAIAVTLSPLSLADLADLRTAFGGQPLGLCAGVTCRGIVLDG